MFWEGVGQVRRKVEHVRRVSWEESWQTWVVQNEVEHSVSGWQPRGEWMTTGCIDNCNPRILPHFHNYVGYINGYVKLG